MASPSLMRIGVLVDRQFLARWQALALHEVAGEADLLVYSCNNTKPSPRGWRHGLYYLVNLFTVRNRMTRRAPWPHDLPIKDLAQFDARDDGNWQELPLGLIEKLRSDRLDVIIKFGMGLLRVPPEDVLPLPILSYHHGDPAVFRGRPAGFYEMLGNVPVVGQVVQRLSNKLDAGEILAFAETKVAPHSYRATLVEAYRHSPLLLGRAIRNCLDGSGIKPEQWGKNYRLPSNGLVITFLLKQSRAALERLFYGMFSEKRWQVATAPVDGAPSANSAVLALSRRAEWSPVSTPAGYRFLADPFFHPREGLLVEAFNSRTSRGEILHIDRDFPRRLSGRGGHYSYPATASDGDRLHVVPEISEWSPALAYKFDGDRLDDPVELRIHGRPALLDPTPFQHGGNIYLFANLAREGQSVLRLWVAEGLRGEFAEHPASPVRISPRGCRMAGGIFQTDEGLLRIGQDLRRAYGDGLSFFRIIDIDPKDYREEWVRDFRFDHCNGPHTLNFAGGQVAFDYYDERLSLSAGVRRMKHRLAASRVSDPDI